MSDDGGNGDGRDPWGMLKPSGPGYLIGVVVILALAAVLWMVRSS